MADNYEMVVLENNQSSEQREDDLSDNQNQEPSYFGALFHCMDANTILRNAQEFGIYICIGTMILVIGAIIFSTAFSTCTNVRIKNNTGDLLFFNSVRPFGAKVHKHFTYPYSRNNATFGVGNDHVSLGTVNNGKLIARNNGECELSDGPNDREFKKYSTSPFFYTCYCGYNKISPNTNVSSAVTRYLRGPDEKHVVTESERTERVKDSAELSI